MKPISQTAMRISQRAFHAIASAVLIFLAASSTVPAAQMGAPAEGQRYARSHCAECHSVEPVTDDMSPNYAAPRFIDIANTPGMTERALAVSMQTPHETMPDLIIPESDRDDLIAYIMSLKDGKPL